jgi:predicted transcriptional regulator
MKLDDGMDYLSRSENRVSLLAALVENQPRNRDELEAELSASKRTVSRVLTELTQKGYLQEGPAGFRLTTFGEVVAEAYLDYSDRFELAEKYRPFLANVDSTAVDLDITALRGASLTVAGDVNPYAPLDRALELRQDATQIRVVTPLIEKRSMEQLTARMERGEDLNFEAIFPQRLYETVKSQRGYDGAFEREVQSDSVELRISPDSIDVIYSIIDDIVALGATVDNEPYALLESKNPDLRAWVEQTIDEYKTAAVPVEEFESRR